MTIRDPVRVADTSFSDIERWSLSIIGPDGSESLIVSGSKSQIEARAQTLRAAIKQSMLEFLRSATEQLR